VCGAGVHYCVQPGARSRLTAWAAPRSSLLDAVTDVCFIARLLATTVGVLDCKIPRPLGRGENLELERAADFQLDQPGPPNMKPNEAPPGADKTTAAPLARLRDSAWLRELSAPDEARSAIFSSWS